MYDIELSIDDIIASIDQYEIDISYESKIYSPLLTSRSIRLLTILPGEFGEIIQSKLEVVEIDDAPDYEALSYVWGNPAPPVEIICNGDRTLVTPNLGAALQRLRYPRRKIPLRRRYSDYDRPTDQNSYDQSALFQPGMIGQRRIWIDAICINQENLHERSQQVSIMQDIYRRAENVVIWLGDDSSRAAEAIDFMERIATLVRKQTGKQKPVSAEIDPSSEMYEVLYKSDGSYLVSTIWFLNLEWFRRIWIVQEVADAEDPRMAIGHLSVAFLDVALSALWLFAGTTKGTLNLSVASTKTVEKAMHIFKSGTGGPLPLLMLRNWQMQATDPRDKIYALLGLSSRWEVAYKNQDQHLAILPDYSSTVVEVYSNMVRKFLSRPKNLNRMEGALAVFLCFKTNVEWEEVDIEQGGSAFPSWVPRLDKKRQFFAPLSLGDPRKSNWTPSGDSVITMKEPADPKSLILKGIIITRIDTVHLLSTDKAPEDKRDTLFELLCTASDKPCCAYEGSDAIMRAIAVTVTGGVSKNPDKHELYNENDFRIYFRKEDRTNADLDIYPAKSFFFTTDGHMGIGTEGMRPGDEICMIFGGEILCIIRPKEGHHVLVGECFVHDYMHGQVIERWKAGELKDEWIDLQ